MRFNMTRQGTKDMIGIKSKSTTVLFKATLTGVFDSSENHQLLGIEGKRLVSSWG